MDGPISLSEYGQSVHYNHQLLTVYPPNEEETLGKKKATGSASIAGDVRSEKGGKEEADSEEDGVAASEGEATTKGATGSGTVANA